MSAQSDDQIVKIRTNAPSHAQSASVSGPWEIIADTREAAGLTRSDLARRARVSELTVEAIETGAVERLPLGDAGTREVLSVCRALRIEPTPFIDAARTRRASALSSALGDQKPKKRGMSWLKVAIAVWILVLGGAIAARLLVADDAGDPAQTSESAETADDADTADGGSDGDSDTESVDTTQAAENAPETTAPPPPEPPPPPPETFTVRLVAASEDTWLQAVVNGEEQFLGTIPEGETREFVGENIQLTIGRPHAVDLIVNDAPHEPARTVQFG